MNRPEEAVTVDLVHLAQEGDRAAFEHLFGRYYPRILRWVRQRVGAGLRRDLESRDILHDSLMVAARKLPQFRMQDRDSLLHWLHRIVEHQIRDRVQWQLAQCRDHGREAGSAEADRPAIGRQRTCTPLEQLVGRETGSLLAHCLGQLPELYRQLIRLRHHERLGWDEIAVRSHRPSAGAARMMYRKAVLELGALMQGAHPRTRPS